MCERNTDCKPPTTTLGRAKLRVLMVRKPFLRRISPRFGDLGLAPGQLSAKFQVVWKMDDRSSGRWHQKVCLCLVVRMMEVT